MLVKGALGLSCKETVKESRTTNWPTNSRWINILGCEQNGRHFADDISKWVFLMKKDLLHLDLYFIEICSNGQWVSFGSGNDLVHVYHLNISWHSSHNWCMYLLYCLNSCDCCLKPDRCWHHSVLNSFKKWSLVTTQYFVLLKLITGQVTVHFSVESFTLFR